MWSEPPFDLKEILAALGQYALSAHWSIGDAPTRSGELDVTEDAVAELKALAATGERIPGTRLKTLSENINQVVWGQFKAYEDEQSLIPAVTLTSIDSSYWQVESEAVVQINKIVASFGNVERLT